MPLRHRINVPHARTILYAERLAFSVEHVFGRLLAVVRARRTMATSILALCVTGTALSSQTPMLTSQAPAPASTSGDKNPTTARFIGIFPGAGHVYAGEKLRGVGYFAGTLGVLALGTLVLAVDCSPGGDCSSSSALQAGAMIVGMWGYTIYDAGRAADRTNAGNHKSVSLVVSPTLSDRDRRGVKLGLAIGGR